MTRRPDAFVMLPLVALVAATLQSVLRCPRTVARDAAGDNATPTIERVRELAELVTLRVEVSDLRETSVEGSLGGLRLAVLARGDVEVAADLTNARLRQLDPAARTAVVLLPPPRAVERAYAAAERAIAEVGAAPAAVDRAKRRAEQVITAWFAAAGWSVTVTWSVD
jgi:hypothetical protein